MDEGNQRQENGAHGGKGICDLTPEAVQPSFTWMKWNPHGYN
ncbi:hypothetical protein [Hazenella coriacea]|nr:hypothetical protein [Hazenella coriacea]